MFGLEGWGDSGAPHALLWSRHAPTEYGGACEVPLGESPFEKQLLEIVETALDEHEMTFIDKDKEAPPPPQQHHARQRPDSDDE